MSEAKPTGGRAAMLARLRELHDELASINEQLREHERVDDETIDALGILVSDVGDMIDTAKEAAASERGHSPETLRERIEDLEARHPRVTEFLRQVVDLLGMAGI